MPFVDRIVFTREKEGIPYWNKFLQGYYDQSGISSDNFDQAVRIDLEGEASLTPEMEARGIWLRTSVGTSTFYLAFNFLDPVVGGLSERARKLRQAISIAVDWEEFISIFQNGRGIPGMGPIPPGIFGYREGEAGVNPVVYDWVDGQPLRKSDRAPRRSCSPRPATRTGATRRPGSRWCSTSTRSSAARATSRGSTGTGSSSRSSTSSSSCATSDWNRFQEKVRDGNTPALLPRLERRLPGSRELHVPAERPAERAPRPAARTRRTTRTRSTTGCSSA